LRVISPPGKLPSSDFEVSLISSPLMVPSWWMVVPLKETLKVILSPVTLPSAMVMGSPCWLATEPVSLSPSYVKVKVREKPLPSPVHMPVTEVAA